MEHLREAVFFINIKKKLTEIKTENQSRQNINKLLAAIIDLKIYLEKLKKEIRNLNYQTIKITEEYIQTLENSFNTLNGMEFSENHDEKLIALWSKIALRATDVLQDLQTITISLTQLNNVVDNSTWQKIFEPISDSLKHLHYDLLIIDNEINKLKPLIKQTSLISDKASKFSQTLPVILTGNDSFIINLSQLNDIDDTTAWKQRFEELLQSLLQHLQFNDDEVANEIRIFLFQLFTVVQDNDNHSKQEQISFYQQLIYELFTSYTAITELFRATKLQDDLQKLPSNIHTNQERLKLQHLLNESHKDLHETMGILRQFSSQLSSSKTEFGEIPIYYKKITREQLQSYLTLYKKNDPITAGSLNDYIKRKYFPQASTKSIYRADLSGVNLAKLNLSHLDLSNTLMVQTKLIGARLKDTDLTSSCLYQANLQKANLTDAKLAYCNLIETDLRGCNLQGAKIFKTLFLGAKGLQTTAEKQMQLMDEKPPSIIEEKTEYIFNQISYGINNILVYKKLLQSESLSPEDKRFIYPTVAMKYFLSLNDKEMREIPSNHPLHSDNIIQSLVVKEGIPHCNYDDETIAKTFITAITCFTRELILITLAEISDNVEQLTKKLLADNTIQLIEKQQIITRRKLACNSYIEAKRFLFLEEWRQANSQEEKNILLIDYIERMHKDINRLEADLNDNNLIIDLTNINLKNQDLSMCQFGRVKITSQQLKFVSGLNTLQGLNDTLLREAQQLKQEIIETLLVNANKTLKNCAEILASLPHLNHLVCNGTCPTWEDISDDLFKKLAYLAMTNEIFINTLPPIHSLAAATIEARGYEAFMTQERNAIKIQLQEVLRTRNNFQLPEYVIALVQCSKVNAIFNDADNIGLIIVDAEKAMQDISISQQEFIQNKIQAAKLARKNFLDQRDTIIASYNHAYLDSTLQHLHSVPDVVLQENAYSRLSTLFDLIRNTKQVLDLTVIDLKDLTLANFNLQNIALKLTPEQVKQLLSKTQQQQLNQAFRKAIDIGDIQLVTRYIENGVDINALDEAWRTPLMAAVVRENKAIVALLLKHGADPSIRTKETAWNIYEYLWRLKEKKNIHFEILDLLSSYYKDEIDLGIATAFNNIELVEKMLKEKGISPNQIFRGETPLHIAVENADISMVALLLNYNANKLLKNSRGYTPFYQACSQGYSKLAELLWVPEINLNDKQYRDLLLLLAKQFKSTGKEDYKKIIQLFYIKGAQGDLESVMFLENLPAIQNFVAHQIPTNLSDALHHAVATNNVVATDWLLGQNVAIKPKTLNLACAKNYLAIVKLLVSRGANVNPLDLYVENPLYVASENGHTEIVAFLLDNKANVSAYYDGRTALHIAAKKGFTNIVELLLAKDAYAMAIDDFGNLPLHEASRAGNTKIVALFLQAVLSTKNEKHETPLNLAQTYKREELLHFFKLLQPAVSVASNTQTQSPTSSKTKKAWIKGNISLTNLDKRIFFSTIFGKTNMTSSSVKTSYSEKTAKNQHFLYPPYETDTQAVQAEDKHWYTDDEMNYLFNYYLGNDSTIELLTTMLGTHWNDGNTLGDNLKQFCLERMQNIANKLSVKNKVLIPVNLSNSHWTLLYIIFEQDAAKLPTIYYFDPLGDEMPEELKNILTDKQLFPKTEIVNVGKRIQQDGYNCGPWVIEAAKAIAKNGSLPEEIFDIVHARYEHKNILSHPKHVSLN